MAAVQPAPTGAPFSIGDEIRRARLDAHMEQIQLARAVGVSRPLISKWENGKSEPTISQFRAIAAATGARWLLTQNAKYLKLLAGERGQMELSLGARRPRLAAIGGGQ